MTTGGSDSDPARGSAIARRALLALAALVASGCSASGAPDPGEGAPGAAPSLRATLGASGGTITGEAGTPFEGVALTLPPGALAGDTDITISETNDPLPLAGLAERVGPQFRIAPPTTLALPARLTVPADPVLVDLAAAATPDLKVWIRVDDHWTARDAVATADGSVTIDLPALTTVAAGVFLSLVQPSCGALCNLGATTPRCPGDFCVSSLGVLSPAPESSGTSTFRVHGVPPLESIYYLTVPATDQVQAVTRLLPSGVPVLSGTLSELGNRRYNPAPSPHDPSYLVGTGYPGNAHFYFPNPNFISATVSNVYSASSGRGFGFGGVTTSDSTLTRFSIEGSLGQPLHGDFTASSWPATDRPSPSLLPVIAPLPAPGSSHFWMRTNAARAWEMDSALLASPTLVMYQAATPPGGGPIVSFAVAPNDTVALRLFGDAVLPRGTILLMAPSGGDYLVINEIILPAPLVSGELAFDSAGNLWILAANAAQVFRYPAAGGPLASVALSADPVGSPTYQARIARHLQPSSSNGAVYVITESNELVQLSYDR